MVPWDGWVDDRARVYAPWKTNVRGEGVAVRGREKERQRGLSSEGVILSIVLRAFLPVTRSPERSRLYHSVYPLFSGTFTVRYRNTIVRRCQSFPLRGSSTASPSRHRDVPARHPLRSSPKSLLSALVSPLPHLSLIFHTKSPSYLISRGKHICISSTSNVSCTLVSVEIFSRTREMMKRSSRSKSRRLS